MKGDNKDAVQGVVLDVEVSFTLHEFCRLCETHAEVVIEMVEHGIIETDERSRGVWHFHGESVTRAQRALRLVRDLGVNWAGAALALDLYEKLREQEQILKRYDFLDSFEEE